MRIKELERLTGGLSNPSKMPGFAYGIPAWECKLGKILRTRAGSVCEKCYALKGMYVFPAVKKAQIRRMKSITKPEWVSWMVELIGKKLRRAQGPDRVFRWHDSGDLQSVGHLEKIAEIARRLPDVKFWLPTRENRMVRDWLRAGHTIPANLIIRISAPMVGQTMVRPVEGTVASTVDAGVGYACPARSQGNACQDCRACWNQEVSSVDYPKH